MLDSWQTGTAKTRLHDFVQACCDPSSAAFRPIEERLAVFDLDGTLWVEKPWLTQLAFFADKAGANRDHVARGTWLSKLKDSFEHWVHDLLNDATWLEHYLRQGLSPEAFRQDVASWIDKALHPRFHHLYTQLCYQPMIELLSLLRANDFRCVIVSGGSADFIRPWIQACLGFSSQDVLGSHLKTKLVEVDGELQVHLEPLPFIFDDGAGKVLSIERALAQQPILAVGNSHGDREMLRYTSQLSGCLSVLVHHTDDVREYKYSPDPVWFTGTSTLELAAQHNWLVVDMASDWRRVFPWT